MNDTANTYYALPLRLDKIISKKFNSLCSLQESIAQNLYLLLTTDFKELRFDPTYGCLIWEQDFEILASIKWKDALSYSLEETIRTHEQRLKDVKVKIEIEEFKFLNKDSTRIKKRLFIRIEGFTVKTNEKFEFMEQIFIAPFSLG
jgi:predicted component of type VI protein secretion system